MNKTNELVDAYLDRRPLEFFRVLK